MVGIFRKISYFLSLSASALLIGCGGAPLENENIVGSNTNTDTRNIDVSVSGSSGTVVVRLNTSDLTFSQDSTIRVSTFTADEQVQATIISSPDGESCVFTPTNQQQVLITNSASVECSAAQISGKIKNFFTDQEVTGATVSVTRGSAGVYPALTSVQTNLLGEYSFNASVSETERTVLTVTADGYAPYTTVVDQSSVRPTVVENIFLVPLNLTDTEPSSASDMVFRIYGIPVLEIPANGLVNGSGGLPAGQITANITVLDPTFSPRVMPGRYQALVGGAVEWLRSYGGISFQLADETGAELSLGGGVSAEVSIPEASGISYVGSASIYAFNDNNGYWESAINATRSFFSLTPIYQASIDDLGSTLMAAETYTPAFATGAVRDSLGNPFAGATVISQGQSYVGLGYTTTDEQGVYSVPYQDSFVVDDVEFQSQFLIYSIVGTQSRTSQHIKSFGGEAITGVDTQLEVDSSTITLTWGEDPADLDSHLFGPNVDGTRFHILYSNPTETVAGVTLFLDVDDTTSFGPEVTTFPSFPLSGSYEFFVKRFSGDSTIQASPARVELNLQGENFVFTPPQGVPTDCWHVFNISVDSSLSGSLVERNDWVAATACDQGLSGGTIGTSQKPGQPAESVSPAMRAIEQKYYAR